MNMKNKYRGCLIGLALGDALCAPYEGGILERTLWKFFSKTRDGKIRYTDDTQMCIDLAESIIAYNGINQDALAERFANSYQWSRGYGPSAAKLLKKIKRGQNWRDLNTAGFKDGSFGNGAAMRIAPVALYLHDNENLLIQTVEDASIITHAHELAITGAKNIALTIALILKGQSTESTIKTLIDNNTGEYKEKLLIAQQWLIGKEDISSSIVAKILGNGIQAINSTITAITIASFFIHKDFEQMMIFIQNCGGDTDSIAAMAGAIWGASNGLDAINHPKLDGLESRQKIIELADGLFFLNQNRHSQG